MRPLVHTLLAGLLGTLAGMPVSGSEPPAEDRPRIGLVLSGGGARGVAHVGVLRTLEQMRIPIDAIAGTSMGAVVGGLYATGMTAEQIERELAGVDWQNAFRDRPERSGLSFRRRREDRDFLVQLPLGFREGRFHLPTGLIQGQKLVQLLRELTLPVAGITRFDDLPTPFRAVATDLETGAAVVMADGDLATALRASLSAPGIFAPVELDGRLLVDGGISNNLPVDVARAMNVDRLIVVDVGLPLAHREGLASVANVANQMLTILMRRETEEQLATLTSTDVLVSPDMPRTSSFNFTGLGRVVDAGIEAAEQAAPRLAELAVSPAQYEQYLAARRQEPWQPVIRSVQVPDDPVRYEAVTEALFKPLAGAPLDVPLMRKRVNRFYGQGLLESLDYRLEPVEGSAASQADLVLAIRPNSLGPNYVRFGLRLQDDFKGNSTFDAATRLLLTDLNKFGAEWVWDAQLGGNPRLGTELYLPLSLNRRWFIEPSALFQIRAVPQFLDDEQVGELRVRSVRFGSSLGRELGESGELRFGAEREIGKSRVRLGDVTDPSFSFQNNEIFARYSFDSLDSAAFPRHGGAATLEWRGQISGRSLDRVSDSVHIDWRLARTWGKHTAMIWTSAGTLVNDEFADERSYFQLGGFLNLSGRSADSLIGPHYGITRLIYLRKIGSGGEGFLNVPMYAGLSLEAGNVWDVRTDMSLSSARRNASLFLGLDTFLGPAWFAVGADSTGRHAFYLSLGRGF